MAAAATVDIGVQIVDPSITIIYHHHLQLPPVSSTPASRLPNRLARQFCACKYGERNRATYRARSLGMATPPFTSPDSVVPAMERYRVGTTLGHYRHDPYLAVIGYVACAKCISPEVVHLFAHHPDGWIAPGIGMIHYLEYEKVPHPPTAPAIVAPVS